MMTPKECRAPYEQLTSSICYAGGCTKERARRRKGGSFNSRYCGMHAMRRLKYGVTWAPVKKVNRQGEGSVGRGYRIIGMNGKGYLEHRVVWERANGPILPKHIIHHINGNKSDNRLENLECITQSEHMKLHFWAKGPIECL